MNYLTSGMVRRMMDGWDKMDKSSPIGFNKRGPGLFLRPDNHGPRVDYVDVGRLEADIMTLDANFGLPCSISSK
ncbi:hypothetical protein TWF718_004525 [Orbilia javanica]|uniref:Uncharacterized protein n=1 Tax=Orbilia javanica TaxID=47235 RepID=A0AAN8MSD5_9PEZI